MKIFTRALTVALMMTGAIGTAQAQEGPTTKLKTKDRQDEYTLPTWGIKTNLLYDATATINLGVEFRTGEKTSLDIPVSYNAWKFSNNRQWRHILVQPELRRWLRQTFDGHFFGGHAHYAFYNVGNLPHGPFSEYMRDHRFEGWLAGVGVSYGYRWNFNRWLGLEATVGVGYAYLDYDKFECQECGALLGNASRHYFGPTKVGLSLIFGIGGKKAPAPQPVIPEHRAMPQPQPEPVLQPQPQPQPEPAPIVIYEPTFMASFVTPEVEAVKVRSETGKAYLDFAVGKSEIVSGFKNNAAELAKMNTLIESVRTNPDATITGIIITGYASPEGGEESNRSLSERRAQALRHYIGVNYGLPAGLFSVYGAGEDWRTLELLIEGSEMPERDRLLEAIRSGGSGGSGESGGSGGSGGDADIRERKLKAIAGGVPYRRLLTDCYPQLRRVEYTLDYTVVPFTVEQGKEVMKTRPGSLSLNEMFLIANTYAPGSDDSGEVFETAARVFPDSDVANLNAAASALGRRDAVSAERYLAKVKARTPEYWNNLGLLQWLQGDKTAAAESFTRAGALGADNAAELEKHILSTIPNKQ